MITRNLWAIFFIISISYATGLGSCARFASRKQKIVDPISVCGSGDPCNCHDHTINCNGEEIKTTFIEDPENIVVKELHMENTGLTALYADQIMPNQEKNIERLYFSHNTICFIENGALDRLQKLVYLDLSFNKLEDINDEAFGLLANLIDLKLQSNLLKNLTEPIFEELRSLKYLYLDNNPIGHLSSDTFRGLSSLEELTLDHTDLAYIDREWFIPLSKLKTLLIRHNKFITAPAISGLPSLDRLDISYNPILELNAHTFEGLTHLRELTISHMPQMWSIEDCAFCGLNRLQKLTIYNCSMLYFIDPAAFGQKHYFQNQLDVIDLARNNLTSLSKSLLPWRNVSTLKLADNPWYCDCNVAWMNDLELNYQEGQPVCAGPQQFRGRFVDTLRNEDFVCRYSTPLTAGRIFIAITVILLIAGTVTMAWYLWLSHCNGPKIRNVFYRPQMPKYAYRNLAMNAETTEDRVNYATDTRKKNVENELPVPVEL